MHPTQSQLITSRHNELFHRPLWGQKQTEGKSTPRVLIRLGLKNIKVLFKSLSLELAQIDFWPAFVCFWSTVHRFEFSCQEKFISIQDGEIDHNQPERINSYSWQNNENMRHYLEKFQH
jgi:hypothetical protein